MHMSEGTRLACGVDLVDIAAFGRALEVTKGRMGRVCFTERERAEGNGRIDRLASRWAVKEAVAKALGVGLMQGVGFHDIEVTAEADGPPTLSLHGKAKTLAARRKLTDWAMTVSHERGFAIAFVIGKRCLGSDRAWSEEERND
jgi:holo-[acyl-carrier protein] synthase